MRRRAHARVGAMAAVALTAALVLTGPPASAAPSSSSITQASCSAEGGTFTRAKGVKTCTVTSPSIRYESPSTLHSATVNGPFTSEFLTASSYYGEWKQSEGYRDTVTKTQKGTGTIVTTTSSVLVRMFTYDQTCWEVGSLGGGITYTPTFPVMCDIAGVYPAEIVNSGG
jgi:hypothetical protein